MLNYSTKPSISATKRQGIRGTCVIVKAVARAFAILRQS